MVTTEKFENVTQKAVSNNSKKQPINRHFLDKEHPFELMGDRLDGWDIKFYQKIGDLVEKTNVKVVENLSVEENNAREKLLSGLIDSPDRDLFIEQLRNKIRFDIYKELLLNISNGLVSDPYSKRTHYDVLEYSDAKKYFDFKGRPRDDRERIYLKVSRETLRGTVVTVFCRVLDYEDYLYIAVDSYSLGQLNIHSLCVQTLFLISIAPLIPISIFSFIGGLITVFLGIITFDPSFFYGLISLFLSTITSTITFGYLMTFWGKVIKGLVQREPFIAFSDQLRYIYEA